jgi:hypothetical protein
MAGDGMIEDTPMSPIEDIIEDAGHGRPFILVEAEAALDGCSLKIVGWRPVTGEA